MALSVQISAKVLTWPQFCACCGKEPADRRLQASAMREVGVNVVRRTQQWWDVPYCDACIEHVELHERPNKWLDFGLVIASVVAGLALTKRSEFGLAPAIVGFVLVSAFFAAVGIMIGASNRSRARGMMNDCCCVPGRAVYYFGWYGAMHSFAFERRDYIDSFLRLNGKKVRSDVVDTATGVSVPLESSYQSQVVSHVKRSSS